MAHLPLPDGWQKAQRIALATLIIYAVLVIAFLVFCGYIIVKVLQSVEVL